MKNMIKTEQILRDVLREVQVAQEKFPAWPEDVVHGAAIVAEEAGELIQAALDRYYGRTSDDSKLIKEAIQTMAMGFRFLFNLVEKPKEEGEKKA